MNVSRVHRTMSNPKAEFMSIHAYIHYAGNVKTDREHCVQRICWPQGTLHIKIKNDTFALKLFAVDSLIIQQNIKS